jgi:Luciferase-like monooxygenase
VAWLTINIFLQHFFISRVHTLLSPVREQSSRDAIRSKITKKIRLGTAGVVLPLYNPARLLAEIATADAPSNGRLMAGVSGGYQPYESERFGVDIKAPRVCDILDRAFQDFFSYNGDHHQMSRAGQIDRYDAVPSGGIEVEKAAV